MSNLGRPVIMDYSKLKGGHWGDKYWVNSRRWYVVAEGGYVDAQGNVQFECSQCWWPTRDQARQAAAAYRRKRGL